MISKGSFRTLVRGLIKDRDEKLIDKPTLEVIINSSFDDQWSELLEAAKYVTSQYDVISSLPNKFIDPRLASAGGMLSQRYYRVQHIVRGDKEYGFTDARNVLFDAAGTAIISAPDFTYTNIGDRIYLFPMETSAVSIRYSFYPVSYRDLSDLNVIAWPEGYELALAQYIAANILTGDDADRLMGVAIRKLNLLASAAAKQHSGPSGVYAVDSPTEWGDD